MDINSRLKVIEDLDCYLLEKNKLLSDICNELGWTEESLQGEIKVQCPNDPGHWVPESSLSAHIEKCSWVKEGYLKEEMDKQPPSSSFFYQRAPSIVPVAIDKETQASILMDKGLMEKKPLDEMPDIPKTVDRWTIELTPEQRLAVYDYAIKEAKSGSKSKNVTVEDLMFDFEKKDDKDGRPKTQLEILAEQRDYKRRRQSYRAKNVHITQKSYTEVMKEVIENHTTILADMIQQETNEKQDDSSTEDKRKKETKKRERSLSPRESSSHEDQKSESRDRHSRSKRSRTPKRKKHKRDRSRSRSRSRKHKKSHRKHKKSRD